MIYVFNKTHTLFNYEHYINFQTIYSKLNSNQIFIFLFHKIDLRVLEQDRREEKRIY